MNSQAGGFIERIKMLRLKDNVHNLWSYAGKGRDDTGAAESI